MNHRYGCQLSSDKCTIPERIEKHKKKRERKGQFLLVEVEQVENTNTK